MVENKSKRAKTENGSSSNSTRNSNVEEFGRPINNHIGAIHGKRGIEGEDALGGPLVGISYHPTEVSNSGFWSIMEKQKWTQFICLKESTYVNWVKFFYRHVDLVLKKKNTIVSLELRLENITLSYTSKEFEEDFGIESSGFNNYSSTQWPLEFMDFVDWSYKINNDRFHTLTETQKGSGETYAPNMHCFTGEDYYLTNCLNKSIVPISSQDRKPNRVTNTLLYLLKEDVLVNLPVFIVQHMKHSLETKRSTALPYGMLITHIMRKWKADNFCERGQEMPPLVYDFKQITRQGLILVDCRFYAMWEIIDMPPNQRNTYRTYFSVTKWKKLLEQCHETVSPESHIAASSGGIRIGERGSNVNVDAHADEIEEDDGLTHRQSTHRRSSVDRGGVTSGGDEWRNKVDERLGAIEIDISHMKQSLEEVKTSQKNFKKYFKGIMKFFKCMNDNENKDPNKRKNAIKYLYLSDSDDEGGPSKPREQNVQHSPPVYDPNVQEEEEEEQMA